MMKVLFMESACATSCLNYARRTGMDEAQTQDLLDRCYHNGKVACGRRDQNYDDYWVNKCLQDDRHKKVTLVSLFGWARSPEGDAYWRRIYVDGGR